MENPTILIVEDNSIVAEDIRIKLGHMGYRNVMTATNYEKAIQAAESQRPDIALMDINLGGEKNGIDTAEALRRDYQVPVVYLTAFADEETIARAKKTEPYGYIVKPFDDKALRSAVEIALYKQKADQKVRESERKLSTLVSNLPGIAYRCTNDENWTMSYISHGCKALTGYEPSELIENQNLSFGDLIVPEDRQHVLSEVQSAVQEDRSYTLEYRILDKNRTERWVWEKGRCVDKPKGTTAILEGFIPDITDRKKAEAEREQLKHQLIQARKMDAISTLTGGIAHDYNNLLAMIMGNLSMAREGTAPHSVMAGFLDEAEQASLKARDLTHELMTLSQGGHPVKKPGSMESLLKEISGQVQAQAGIEYIFSIQNDLWPLEYDARQMRYAISSVLMNAVEAMPRGGKITLQTKNQVIDNQGKEPELPLKEGKYVRLFIEDEGRGIPEEDIEKIFDPYFSTKERGAQKGMGLGLTTAYAVIQKHGGHILVDSTTGVGTTVSIYLPAMGGEVQSAQADDAQAQSTIANQQSSIRRILVMDDEEMLRTLARKMLERLGCEVETVRDGVEAIETYKKHLDSGEPFDGAILDLTIKGGMGGEQTMKDLILIDPSVRGIVCSGYFNDPVMANYADHGFRGAMAKPYQMADIEGILREILG